MLCESCGNNPATVHLTDVSNNSKREVHLCEDCARGQGVPIKSYLHKPAASSQPSQVSKEQISFISQVVSQGEPADEGDLKCPTCGLGFKKFRSTGKFGCADDYEVFQEGLVHLLEKIHGKTRHRGKVPKRASAQIARQEELRVLRAELDEAIRGEAYERAASLRDRIFRLEGRKPGAKADRGDY